MGGVWLPSLRGQRSPGWRVTATHETRSRGEGNGTRHPDKTKPALRAALGEVSLPRRLPTSTRLLPALARTFLPWARTVPACPQPRVIPPCRHSPHDGGSSPQNRGQVQRIPRVSCVFPPPPALFSSRRPTRACTRPGGPRTAASPPLPSLSPPLPAPPLPARRPGAGVCSGPGARHAPGARTCNNKPARG